MEPNDHFNYTALPTANTISSLKAEKLLTNGSSLASPPHKNGVNGNMNVNGLTAVSSTSTSGTLTSTTHSNKSSLMHHPNVAYDYLWNHTQCRSANSVNLNPKDNQLVPQFHALGPYQQNGLAESLRPATMRDPELWGKGTRSSMELGFTSPELYDSYHDDGFEPLKNGPSDFYSTPRPSPMLASSVQAFATSPCQEQESSQLGDDCVKDILPIAVGETVELESLEPSDEQTDLKLCNYNGTSSPINPLDIPVVPPPPDVTSCLDDSSQLSSQLDESHLLSSEGLEPFGTDLSRDSVGGGLYDLEETVSEVEQTSLGGPADLSSLDCTDTPSFANTTSFSMLTEDSQNSTSLFAATAASSVLEDSVMQDDGCSELQSELEADVESDREPDLSLNLQNISQEEVVGGRSKEPVADEELVHDGSSTEAVADEELVQDGSTAGDNQRRRAATAEEVYFPIKHGWRREVHIRKGNNRWQGETSYYAPCGKRMKQFPEVIKYLSRNPCAHVRREHFSFSPRMPVGDFYEEASTAEGLKWVKLASEEIPSCILAITGKRGRPRSIEKLKAKVGTRLKRGRGRPPKVKAVDLLNKADSKLMELEPQEELNREDKVVLRKIKKMRRKERDKRKQDVKAAALKEAEKQAKLEKKTEKVRREKQDKEKEKVKLEQENVNIPEEEKLCIPEQETVNVAVERKLETQRRLEEVAQRKLEERRRQHLILEEMKKSTEDMCLVDHQPLPEFTRIPGLFLPSSAFADCLTVVEFLHSYGKVLGFDVPKEVPSLCTLQEGLFNVGDSLGELMDLLIRLLRLALRDPGMPSYCQSLKVLGDKISELELNRDTVSEVLRIFMEVYGADLEICNSLRSKPFQAHPPETKAAILAFLVNELNGSTTIICEIDKTLENMSKQRRNKWIIEGRLRRLRIALAKKMGRPESEISRMEQPWRRRKLRAAAEQEEGDDRCLGAVGMDALDESVQVKRSVKEEEGESPSSASALELERQIEKLTKRQTFFRRKLLHASQGLRAVSLGQDRYRRHYWVLPHLGGIFVEGMDGTQAPHDDFSEEREESFLPVVPKLSPIKSEPTEMLIRDKTSNSNHRRRGRPRKPKVEREVLLTLLSPTSPFGLGQQQQQSSFPPLKVELPSPQPLQQKPPPPQPLRLPSPQSQQLLPSLSLQQKQDSPPPLWHELPSPQSLKQEPSSPSPLPFPQSLQSPPSLSLRQKPDSPPPLQQEPPSPQLLKQELPPPLPSSQSLESQPSLSLKQKPDSPPPLRPPSPQFLKQESPPHLPLRLPAPQLLQSPASLALQPELPSPLPLQQEQPLPRPLHLPFPQPPFSQILQHKPDYFPPPRRQTPSPPPPRVPYKKKRKHSSKSKVANGFFEEAILISQSQVDLSQSAFLSFLSQTQNSLLDSSMLTPASSPGNPETSPIPPEEILETYPETDIVDTESARQGSEKLGQWFHLLPRKPCNVSSVDPTKTTSTENAASEAPHPCDTFCPTATTCKLKMRRTSCSSRECLPVDVPTHVPTISTPIHNTRAHNPLRKIAVIPADTQHSPRDVCNGPSPVKRRGRPPTKFLKQIEQKYFTQLTRHPIPKAMKIGWWWIRDPEQFEAVLKVLHPRGIREKTLQKHLTKHKDYLKEVCLRPSNDPIFKYIPDAGHPVCPMTLQKWSTVERALEVDLPILQWVEELEQRVVFSDLQLRGWMLPPLDSTREDLQYYEHKVDPSEDITIRLKKEGMELWRVNTHPLDRAVQRLADLELNIERRYLKEPLWLLSEVVTEKLVLTDSEDGEVTQTEVEYAITPRLRTWRQTVERCRSAAQLSLCIYQLDKSIAWEKSVNKVICLVCRKGDNDELLLLCESCDRGCHTYCHRPKISEIPSEDWFCPICISRQADGEYLWTQSTLHRGTKRRVVPPSSLLDDGITKNAMTMRRRDNCGMGVSRYSGEGLSPSKRRRMSVRNDDNSDLAFCEIILMEMEAQDDAWPFLEPVNPRLVPGYRKIIKKPMDFSTMREKLLSGGYSCCEEFAADAMLVFNNCQMFNEDDSEVGRAGLVMKCFYESRWEEFYRGKMEENM